MTTYMRRPPLFDATRHDPADPDALAAGLPTATQTGMDLTVESSDADGFVVREAEPWEGGTTFDRPGDPGGWVVTGPGISVDVMTDADFHAAFIPAAGE
jgi:hypothetical protein